jgi:hypothetical protein
MDLGEAFKQAGLVAKFTVLMGLVPLGMGILYAISPTEQRLALMRPVSLAAIFAAISGTIAGVINVLVGMSRTETPVFSHVAVVGLAESLVPVFFGFGCLTVAWLCVAFGMWRKA